jgi:uncharacterized protein
VKVAVTGATGTIGRAVVAKLRERGDQAIALSRDPDRAREVLGDDVEAHAWRDPKSQPAPAEALADADAVVHLLGEEIAQRWTDSAKREIRDSRVLGTRNLVAGLKEAGPRLRTLVSQSGSNYYGAHGPEPVDESVPPAGDFLASLVQDWEAEALRAAEEAGVRVVVTRTGVVLSPGGGALKKMMPFFKAGVGGPVAGGGQYLPWIHLDDVAGVMLFALDHEELTGPVNAVAPGAVTNKEFSKALGRAIRRPAVLPVPALALKVLYGEMSMMVTEGARLVPGRLEEAGYRFAYPEVDAALRSATS